MNIRWTVTVGAFVGIALGIGVARHGVPGLFAQSTASWTPAVSIIASPAAPNAAEPQLTVSNRGVLLSWIEHTGTTTSLRFAERTVAGWTQPRSVSSGDDWSINAIDVPSVLRLSNGTLVAQWLQKSGAGMHANDVRLSYSKDDGRTWAPSFTPYSDRAPRERLFASLFELPSATLGLIWLNGGAVSTGTSNARSATGNQHQGAEHGREHGAGHQGQQGHEGPAGAMGMAMGDMSLRFASFDGAWKQTAEMPIDPRVCECCSTAAVVTSEGVLATYRNRSDDEIRDIYVSRLLQGRWSEPSVVHADNWRIPACPINGPALAANGRNVAIAWYTVKDDQGHAYVAFSSDAGRRFTTPTRLDDTASTGRVDIELLPDASALATWVEVADGRSQFRARRVARDGTRSPAVTIATLAGGRTGGVPRISRSGDELVFAWTEASGGASQVRTAIARVPGR